MSLRRAPWIAVLLFLVQAPLYVGYVTDDSYIYARFAENLARHGELAFNRGEPVHAATSPLWAAFGAIGVWLGLASVQWLKALGIAAGAAAVFVLARVLVRELGPMPRLAWVFVLVAATEPWLVRWSSSAMETALGALLVAIAVDATWRPVASVAWRRASVAIGLLPLVRPEALLLVALFGLHVVRTPLARRRVDLYVLALAPFALWSAIAIPLYGHALPETMRAKSTPLGLQPDRLLANVLVLGQIYAVGLVVPALLWLSGVVRRPRRLLRSSAETWGSAPWWQWTVALPLVYLLRDVQVISRYLEVVFPVVIVLAASVVAGWRASRPVAAAAVAQVVLALGLTVVWIAPSARDFGTSLERGLGEIADWLRTETPPDATVAIYDIGLVGQRGERRVLDLGGLIHPGINVLRDTVDDATILREGLFLRFERPDYLVDRDYEAAVLDGERVGDVELRAILSREVANLGLSRGRAVVYTLYEVVGP